MRRTAPLRWIPIAVLGAVLFSAAGAQTADESAEPPRDQPDGRLFLGFDREAVLVDRQWWEGQLEFTDQDAVDISQIRLVVALQPFDRIEFGGRVGFGSSDTPGGELDGNGASDLDLWAKFALGKIGEGRMVAGVIATVPTGDDSVGLGNDAFVLGGYLALRQPVRRMTIHADIGMRLQQDGRIFGVDQDGRTSGFVGFGLIAPISDRLDAIAEARFETERFTGRDEDARALGGIDWRLGTRSRLRGAIGLGLTDGAPDVQFIVGWAATF